MPLAPLALGPALGPSVGPYLLRNRVFVAPMAGSGVFPPRVATLIRVGAESGQLPETALYLADMYETKLETAMQRLVSVLEPAIIILVSLLVAFIVLSIMGAIVGVYDLTIG